MIISEKQIMQLLTIAQAHIANSMRFGESVHAEEVQNLIAAINDQQSEELKEVK
ncbi:MAG: hypothetical protein AB7F29_13880 [Candidatus Nitrosocosmicus sp.]